MTRLAVLALFGAAAACTNDRPRQASGGHRLTPDELPALVASELPFKYPASLYARKVQGNVTLKLFIDRDGRVVAESTHVNEPSGYPALDSAAVAGAKELRFVPAKAHGEAIPLSILFPVYFRHPEARPMLGDSILNQARGRSG